MRILCVIALVLLVLGTPMLHAGPEDEDDFTLGLGKPFEVDAAWAEVVRPVTRFEMPGPSSVEAPTIELPEMHLFRVKKTVALPAAGGFLLAGGGRALEGASLRVVVLQVKVVKR